MFRLTLNTQSGPEIHLFNKSTLLIGSDSSKVDLTLSWPEIQPIHLKIAEQDGFIVILNVANDPFISLNGHPFGKKLLNHGDIILIHDTEILFENLPDSPCTTKLENPPTVTSQEVTTSVFDLNLPLEDERIEVLTDEEWHPSYIDQYLTSDIKPKLYVKEALASQAKSIVSSLKDDYLRDLEDDQPPVKSKTQEPKRFYQAWRWIFLFIFSIFVMAGIFVTVVYFSVSDRTEAQETKASQGVADIAIALLHAQMNNYKPHNQNWSDVDFLKSNLQTILPNTSSYAYEIDSQGQFKRFPYSLRIYTSSDLSHFLLIAQPAPSLLQWLIPKSVILVDSLSMELRIVKDVRSLNRLLANPDPLEGLNGKEILALVKQGTLLRLSTLASESGQTDFSPPHHLAKFRPGSENLIYNAPRYYRLGQGLTQKALHIASTKATSQEVLSLKQDVERFSHLNQLILYAEQGKKTALQLHQSLTTFAPTDKLIFGYLVFNSQGKIYQAHLLKDEDFPNPSTTVAMEEEEIALNSSSDDELSQQDEETIEQGVPRQDKKVDPNHPLYLQLMSLSLMREKELKPIANSLQAMLDLELLKPDSGFQFDYQEILNQFLTVEARHQKNIKEALNSLYLQYEDISVEDFFAYVKAVGFEKLIQHNDQVLSLNEEDCAQKLEILLAHIEESKNLMDLNNYIHLASSWLTFDYIKDPEEMARFQTLLRNQILRQLERLLLSNKKHLTFEDLNMEEREILRQIFSHERLVKPEEQDFFLAEFERLQKEVHEPEVSSVPQNEANDPAS